MTVFLIARLWLEAIPIYDALLQVLWKQLILKNSKTELVIPKGSNLFQLLFDFISITLAVWAILPKDTTNVMHVTANRQPKRKFITNIINSASITFNNYFIILSLLFHVGSYSPEENFDA